MMTSALIADDQILGRPNNFLTSLLAFCVDSFSTCLSRDADKLCVPAGLTLLSALLLLLSCLLIVCQKCKIRGENPGETMVFLYCFLGNLCSTTGAFLSKQLHIQILMGAFAAAVDFVNWILCCCPVLLRWDSKAAKKLRMIKRRRRQHLLAMCVLMVVAGGFLKPTVSHPSDFRPVRERRLLHVPLQVSSWSPLTDNTVILGYILGLLSFVIACTSRIPALCRACKGHKFTRTAIFSGLLYSLAGALYSAAILLYDTQFGFLMRVMPWLLSSTSCATLDLLILIAHWCKRSSRQKARFFPDTEHLLGDPGLPAKNNTAMKRQTTELRSVQAKTESVQKMTEVGQYMDVSIQPARNETTLSKGELENSLHNKKVGLIRVDSFCSTDTSCDSSMVSSDLEWDFETQWSKLSANQQERDEFPLQEWPKNPKPFDTCALSMSRFTHKAPSFIEQGSSAAS